MIYDIQKASILKRISAFLLDFILLGILTTGFGALMSVIVNFDGAYQEHQYYIDYYSEQYDTDISTIPGEDATKEEIDKFNAALEAFNKDENATAAFGKVVSDLFLMVSIGFLCSYAIIEFALPLIFKHGRTLGKKVFSIGVIQVTGVKISPIALFVRAILGKYTIETMVPISLLFMIMLGRGNIITIIIMGALLILQVVLFFATKRYAVIHDVLASTVVVDMQTQMIFDTKEDMLHYKEELSRQAAERAEYK